MIIQRHHIDEEIGEKIKEKDNPGDDLEWIEWALETLVVHICSFLDYDLFGRCAAIFTNHELWLNFLWLLRVLLRICRL